MLGHIGVTPQTATLYGGYRIQGRNAASSDKLVEDAKSLEKAGAFGIVLEMITEEVARVITETVSVPTIGIGSGGFATAKCWYSMTSSDCTRASSQSSLSVT